MTITFGHALIVAAIVGVIWLSHRLGIEVGRDRERRAIRAAQRRVEARSQTVQHSNFRVIDTGQTPRQDAGANNNN